MFSSRRSRCVYVCVCVCLRERAQNWYFLSSTISTANSRRRIPVNNGKQQINSLFKQFQRPAVCRWQTRLTPPTRNDPAKFQRNFLIHIFRISLIIFMYNVVSIYHARSIFCEKSFRTCRLDGTLFAVETVWRTEDWKINCSFDVGDTSDLLWLIFIL